MDDDILTTLKILIIGESGVGKSSELPCRWQLHRGYSHGVRFQFSFQFSYVLRSEGFSGGRSANPATNRLIKTNSTAGGRPQTQLGAGYGWPLAHKELVRPLTGFVFNPAGCPYPNTLLTRTPGWRDGLAADNPTMGTG
uniref:Uncharacterized protein n=1 Tax=Eptatretus burgeri TaxID=7764 RepID=A0A8C4NDT7_EPTBU